MFAPFVTHNTGSRARYRALLSNFIAITLIAAASLDATAQTTTLLVPRQSAARADMLRQRAERLFESPARYGEAAKLLRQAAALRGQDDPRATDELLLAGRLAYYAGDWSNARRMLAAGASRALTNGQLARAANAYIDAAFSALAHGQLNDALAYTQLAERIAASPHLQLDERSGIRGRIGRISIASNRSRDDISTYVR